MRRSGAAASYASPPRAKDKFDYTAPAEVFMTRGKPMRRLPVTYRRFSTAAEAIQYAIEEVPAPLLIGAVMEVSEERFDHLAIRELYDGAGYPLVRH
jgi:hypothetical protein